MRDVSRELSQSVLLPVVAFLADWIESGQGVPAYKERCGNSEILELLRGANEGHGSTIAAADTSRWQERCHCLIQQGDKLPCGL